MSKSRRNRKPAKVYPTNHRYDKRVPPTAFRIDPDTKKTLFELREASNGETWAKVFRRLVGDVELKLKSIEEAKDAGYELGFRDARSQFAVSFPCAKCGHAVFVNGPEQIAQIRELIIKARLGHPECPIPYLPKPTAPKPTPPTMNRPNPNPPITPVEKSANQVKILRFLQS